jgi:hypothetical protein
MRGHDDEYEEKNKEGHSAENRQKKRRKGAL